MVKRPNAFVTAVLAAVAAEAGLAVLPWSGFGVVLPLAAQQKPQLQPFRPGSGLIDQIRSGDIYRFGGARAPGRDWSFGWKASITDPSLNTYEIRDFQEPRKTEDVPAFVRPVDLVIGVNDKPAPATSGHWRVPVLPGELFMHPASDLRIPTARFVVPVGGEYTITGFFQNIGCNGGINGIVSVVSEEEGKPSVRILAERPSNAEEAPYKIIRDFKQGDLIDFSVDAVGNYSCDSTRLDAQIAPSQRVAPVPPDGMVPVPSLGPDPGVETRQPQSNPQPPKTGSGGTAAPPPSKGQPVQGQAGASKSKARPAPSGVLDVQVKWWLWPGNQTQPKQQPKQQQPKPKPNDKAALKPGQPPVAANPAPIVNPPVQSITPQPDPKPATAPAPQPDPEPRPQINQPQPQSPQPQPEAQSPQPQLPQTAASNPQPSKPQASKPQPSPSVGVGSVDYSPIFARGVAKAAVGDKRGAIADFTQAIAINPKLAPAYYSRGVAKLELKDKSGACADFKIARALGDVAAAAAEKQSCPTVSSAVGR